MRASAPSFTTDSLPSKAPKTPEPAIQTLSSSSRFSTTFSRTSKCHTCSKTFNLLRRRHHCRRCRISICKDCGTKAIDKRKSDFNRSQWYCWQCIQEDDQIVGLRIGSRRDSYAKTCTKICLECGHEMAINVKFCIECGNCVAKSPSNVVERGEFENLAEENEDLAVDTENLTVESEDLAVDTEELAVESEKLAVEGDGERLRQTLEQERARLAAVQAENEDLKARLKAMEKRATELKEIESQTHLEKQKKAETFDSGIVIKEDGAEKEKAVVHDERYAKYFKLKKMGMPLEQIKLKASAENLDPSVLDSDFTEQPPKQEPFSVVDDPEYAKFFKLLRMGMPKEQVKLKMTAANLDPAILDTASPTPPAPTPPPLPTQAVVTIPSKETRTEPSLPKKKVIQPAVELRSLFWSRLPVNVIPSTLWADLNDEDISLNDSEMEYFFRKNPSDPQKKDDEPKKKKENPETPQQILLLEPKRQQNVAIAIARMRMPASQIKDAIFALDTTVCHSEILNVLVHTAPTLEEQDLLKNFDGDVKLLGNVEKFFLEMLSIPRYTQRIKCIRFKLQFENRVLETQAQLDTLSAAMDEVSESTKFRAVLQHILAIGNHLNGSTPRGAAYGFKLDTLCKLHTLRSIDPKITVLHYLLWQLESRAPELITFAAEFSHVHEAKRMSLDQLRSDIALYTTELRMLQGQVAASKQDTDAMDRFYAQMEPFAKEAALIIDDLYREFQAFERAYADLVRSFGEDMRKLGTLEFFSILSEFVDEFKKAYRQNQNEDVRRAYEDAAKALRTAEELRQTEVAERDRKAKDEAILEPNGFQAAPPEQSKALYANIMARIAELSQSNPKCAHATEEFKSISRKFGNNEISADAFCLQIRTCLGKKRALDIIPDSARLLHDDERRQELYAAYQRAVKAWNSKPRVTLPSIEPVVGEAAHLLHNSILEAVQHTLQGDTKKMKVFTSNARKYGKEQLSAKEYYQYLVMTFDLDFVGRLVPDLARLLQDAEKRHALLRALCESAPGWERFNGL